MKKVRAPRKLKKQFLKHFPYSEYSVRLQISRDAFELRRNPYYANMHLKDTY